MKPTPAIDMKDVSFAYGAEPVVSGLSLRVESGERLVVLGPNGGGKTTLVKLILGMLEPQQGEVRVLGQRPAENLRQGDQLGYVPQRHEFERRFPLSVRDVVYLGLVGCARRFGRPKSDERNYAEQIIDQLDLRPWTDRAFDELSGGWQQRVLIGRALVCRPKLLLLDEPTVGIDTAGQKQFAELIRRLHEQMNLTVIMVSHDLRAISSAANRVALLNRNIHFHDAPQGLTADLAREVFEHDVAGWLGSIR